MAGIPLELNGATQADLEALPGVGPVTAEAILAVRASKGSFRSVEDLRQVRGIGPKTLERLRSWVWVQPLTGTGAEHIP